jgi:hypothetical protein
LLGTNLDAKPATLLVTNFSSEPSNLLNTTVTEVAEPRMLLVYGMGLLAIGLMVRRPSVNNPLNYRVNNIDYAWLALSQVRSPKLGAGEVEAVSWQ